MATSSTSRLVTCADDAVKVWEVSSGGTQVKLLVTIKEHTQAVRCARWEPSGRFLASSGADGRVVLSTPSEAPTLGQATSSTAVEKPGEEFGCLAFNDDARLLAVAHSRDVEVYDLKDNAVSQLYRIHKERVTCLAFSIDGGLIISGCGNGELYVHSISKRATIAPLLTSTSTTRGSGVLCVAFSPHSVGHALSGHDDGSVVLWDVPRRKHVAVFRYHAAPVKCAVFSTVSPALALSVSADGLMVFFDIQTFKSVKTVQTAYSFSSLCFMSDGATVVAGTDNGMLLFFDLNRSASPTGMQSHQIDHAHSSAVASAHFQPPPPRAPRKNRSATEF
eukprot:RCo010368